MQLERVTSLPLFSFALQQVNQYLLQALSIFLHCSTMSSMLKPGSYIRSRTNSAASIKSNSSASKDKDKSQLSKKKSSSNLKSVQDGYAEEKVGKDWVSSNATSISNKTFVTFTSTDPLFHLPLSITISFRNQGPVIQEI